MARQKLKTKEKEALVQGVEYDIQSIISQFPRNEKTVDIPIRLIEANDWNPNEMSADAFNLLAENVDEIGFADPLYVTPILPLVPGEEPRFRIVDGEHRFEQQRMMDAETIPCVIGDPKILTEKEQKRQTVRLNMIKGKVNPKKLASLVTDLIENHDVPYEDMAHELGFANPTELESLLSSARSSLPTEEMRKEFDKAKDEIKTIDDLSLVLNRLFTKYGDTLPANFMILDFGGKEHLWIRLEPRSLPHFKEKARECLAIGYTFDSVMAQLLLSLNPVEYISTHKELLKEVVIPAPKEADIDDLLT